MTQQQYSRALYRRSLGQHGLTLCSVMSCLIQVPVSMPIATDKRMLQQLNQATQRSMTSNLLTLGLSSHGSNQKDTRLGSLMKHRSRSAPSQLSCFQPIFRRMNHSCFSMLGQTLMTQP